jgi:hypothetical protein
VIRALAILGALLSGAYAIALMIGWGQPSLLGSVLNEVALCCFCIKMACDK